MVNNCLNHYQHHQWKSKNDPFFTNYGSKKEFIIFLPKFWFFAPCRNSCTINLWKSVNSDSGKLKNKIGKYRGTIQTFTFEIRIQIFWFCFTYNPGHTDVARVLIEHGAEMNAKEENEWTPLHLAAQNGNCLNFCFSE